MRLLHTGDWHLGRIFYGRHLTEDQAYVLEHQFFQIIKDQKIDGILLSGDVFDRSVPPVEAVELWDAFITKLSKDYHIPLYAISGNHDGPERLEIGRSLLEQSAIHIWGTPERSMAPLIVPNRDGDVAICPMPFSEPRRISVALSSRIGDVTDVFNYNAMYNQWSEHLLRQIPKDMRRIALCHAFVAGGEVGGSERALTVGGTETVHPSIFSDFHYTALGHLHGSQRAGADTIRYSGSLLKYSFDEWKQEKSFTIVDMDAKGNVALDYIPVEYKRDVVVLEGYFEDLLHNENLQQAHKNDYVQVQLLDRTPILDGMAKLRKLYPYCMCLELVGRMEQHDMPQFEGSYKNLNERQLFSQFAEAVWKEPLTKEENTYIDKLWDTIIKEE